MAESLGITSQTINYDGLFAGAQDIATEGVTILTGANLVRGTVLGKVSAGTVPTTGTAGTNTGNGTCGSVTGGTATQIGVYTLTCTAAAANAGTFQVQAPDGGTLPQATVAVAYTSNQINFTIADGAVDFAVGDTFTVTVPAGSGKYRAYNSANIDGSANPVAILAEDAAAAAADVVTSAYFAGSFVQSKLTGYAAAIHDTLRALGIYVKEAD
jgi:hypothetical protein